MGKGLLAPGFRFHPTDVELIRYYLRRKVLRRMLHFDLIAEVEIYKFSPWDLTEQSRLKTGDLKWYFFCPRGKKYSTGSRMNRATESGYWKPTGKDRCVNYNNEVAGMIKTLIFHTGKSPKGERTDWVMHEYRLEEKEWVECGIPQDAYVLCVIFKKDGVGPKNCAQYGAPFNEDEWDDDDDDDENVDNNVLGLVPVGGTSTTVPVYNEFSSIFTSSDVPPSKDKASASVPPALDVSNNNVSKESSQVVNVEEEVNSGTASSLAVVSEPASLLPVDPRCCSSTRSSEILPPAYGLPPVVSFAGGSCSDDAYLPPPAVTDVVTDVVAPSSDVYGSLPIVVDAYGSSDGFAPSANASGPPQMASDAPWFDAPAIDIEDDDIRALLASLAEDGNDKDEMVNHPIPGSDVPLNMYDFGDFSPGEDGQFLELIDLDVPLDFSAEGQGHGGGV
ncbi:hypothetical protein Tsubulata_011171 [Turnera subulata]|uniref:NAC domain-containing protein n=1 Tax=Turnera subulata TaxID=218843 RepID=A0A9Q0F6P5_9ROSI|nr:hypothetical protein Tsubulata_011171 [Turnera subulata]